MSKRESGAHAAESSSPPAIVCVLLVDVLIDEVEVEIRCERIDGVDRVFSTSMDWLRAERPSEGTLVPAWQIAELSKSEIQNDGVRFQDDAKNHLLWCCGFGAMRARDCSGGKSNAGTCLAIRSLESRGGILPTLFLSHARQ
jgi:hypothetical protein